MQVVKKTVYEFFDEDVSCVLTVFNKHAMVLSLWDKVDNFVEFISGTNTIELFDRGEKFLNDRKFYSAETELRRLRLAYKV